VRAFNLLLGQGAQPAAFDKNLRCRAHIIQYICYGGRALIKTLCLWYKDIQKNGQTDVWKQAMFSLWKQEHCKNKNMNSMVAVIK